MCYHKKFVSSRTQRGSAMTGDEFYTVAAAQKWFAEQLKQFPALPGLTATKQELLNLNNGDAELPQLYEAMVGYRWHLQLAHNDQLSLVDVVVAFTAAAQEAGKLTIIEGWATAGNRRQTKKRQYLTRLPFKFSLLEFCWWTLAFFDNILALIGRCQTLSIFCILPAWLGRFAG